jgi:hypothetical protein
VRECGRSAFVQEKCVSALVREGRRVRKEMEEMEVIEEMEEMEQMEEMEEIAGLHGRPGLNPHPPPLLPLARDARTQGEGEIKMFRTAYRRSRPSPGRCRTSHSGLHPARR